MSLHRTLTFTETALTFILLSSSSKAVAFSKAWHVGLPIIELQTNSRCRCIELMTPGASTFDARVNLLHHRLPMCRTRCALPSTRNPKPLIWRVKSSNIAFYITQSLEDLVSGIFAAVYHVSPTSNVSRLVVVNVYLSFMFGGL